MAEASWLNTREFRLATAAHDAQVRDVYDSQLLNAQLVEGPTPFVSWCDPEVVARYKEARALLLIGPDVIWFDEEMEFDFSITGRIRSKRPDGTVAFCVNRDMGHSVHSAFWAKVEVLRAEATETA